MFEYNNNGGYVSSVPYYRPMAYMPQQMQQPMQRMPGMNAGIDLISVNGKAGADAYRIDAPNSRVALFDSNADIFYLKETDGGNYPTVRAFRFTEIVPDAPEQQTGEYVSREEFNSFKSDLEEAMRSVQQLVQKAPTGTAAADTGE